MRAVALNSLLAIAGVLAGFLVFEGGARLLYREPWYEQLIAEQIENGDAPDINRAALHRPPYSKPKSPRTRRVLVLGDSFTYGTGVPDGSKVFASLLERALNEELDGIGAIEVGNGGLPGSLTAQWLEIARAKQRTFEPDVVLIVFFLRDGTTTSSRGAFFEPIREMIAGRNQDSQWYRHLYSYRLIRDNLDKQKISREYTSEIIDSYLGDEQQRAEWENAKRNILEIARIAVDDSAVAGLVIFPILVGLDRNYPFREVCDTIEDFARENAIPVHSLLPDFLGHDGATLWVSPYDQHPNPEGHRIAADSMLPFVRDLLKASEEISRGASAARSEIRARSAGDR